MAWDKDLEQLHRRRELADAQGGETNVECQHATGRLTVCERIDQLVDSESPRKSVKRRVSRNIPTTVNSLD